MSKELNFQSYNIQNQDLLELWKYFEERGDIVKQRMLSIVTWLLALAAGLLGFTVKELKILSPAGSEQDIVALILGFVGVGICGYAAFMIKEFGGHMKANWDSADRLINYIEPLKTIKNLPDDLALNGESLPRICWRVLYVAIGFGIAFISVIIIAAISMR